MSIEWSTTSNRAVLSDTGNVRARVDYTAYGEDIGAGTGLRTNAQGFDAAINPRQHFGLTERDAATGLDHTWFRKNEGRAGRWTSPDPYNGSISLGDPQSFNRFVYVRNEPTNFVDPSGLLQMRCEWKWIPATVCLNVEGEPNQCFPDVEHGHAEYVCTFESGGGGGGGGHGFRLFGSTYDTITPKRGEDDHASKCRALAKAVKSAIREAQRHLDQYGSSFLQWRDPNTGYWYTRQLENYQTHLSNARKASMEYLMFCSDQGPPPPIPVLPEVPRDIREMRNKSTLERMWDSVPSLGPFPTNEDFQRFYRRPGSPRLPFPAFPIPVPAW